jgi:glycosyltransferase involved in cell wall biosynthesis
MKLSIIIAAFNVEAFIKKCIKSCVYQTLAKSEYEIIIVDDGSTDSTLEIVNQLSKSIGNLRVFTQPNSGLGASRNTGLKHSTGDYIWFIDGDDYIDENCIEDFIQIIGKKNLDVLVLNYTPVDSDYKALTKSVSPIYNGQPVISGSSFYNSNYSISYTPLFVFKRNLFTDYDILFKERINMQDSEILPKLMINTNRLSFFGKNAYYYVQHPNSFTNTTDGEKRLKYFQSMIEVHQSLNNFRHKIITKDETLAKTIKLKLDAVHVNVLVHLIYFVYKDERLKEIIELLTANEFYPLKAKVKGKMMWFKLGINFNPILAKNMIDLLRKINAAKS